MSLISEWSMLVLWNLNEFKWFYQLIWYQITLVTITKRRKIPIKWSIKLLLRHCFLMGHSSVWLHGNEFSPYPYYFDSSKPGIVAGILQAAYFRKQFLDERYHISSHCNSILFVRDQCVLLTKVSNTKRAFTQIAKFMGPTWGPHGAHLGPVGPRWALCWPHGP